MKQASMTLGMRPEWNGRRYRCIVTDEVGNYVKSEACTLTVTAPRKPPAPDEVTFSAEGRRLTVSWTRMPSATHYIVYWGTEDDIGKAKSAAQGTSNQKVFTDWSYGTTYYVWVKAKNGLGTSDAAQGKVLFHAPVECLGAPYVSGYGDYYRQNTWSEGTYRSSTVSVRVSYTKGTRYQWQMKSPDESEWKDFNGAAGRA